MQVEIKTPMLPESVAEATMLAWHKNVGDTVQRDEILVEIETEKIVLEVPAPNDGVIKQITKAEGATIYAEEVLGVLEIVEQSSDAQPQESDETEQKDEPEISVAKTESNEPEESDDKTKFASPAAKRLIDEHKIEVGQVTGTGKDGRITKGDVLDTIEAKSDSSPAPKPVSTPPAPPPPVVVPKATSGERAERRQPMSRIRRTIASRLVESQQTAALLTTFNEVDLSEVMSIRSKHRSSFEDKYGVRLGFMSFFVKASVEALKSIPAVNASIEGNDIVYHDYCDVGIAVSSHRGLVVPVVRDAEQKSFGEIEQEIRAYGQRASAGSLTLEELSGGTFTITNGGVFGSLVSTPIVNPPQSAILGMHKIQERPIALDGQVVIRPMMYLALTYDHRIIDGREAVTFLVKIKESLEDPTRLLLEL